MRPRAVEANAFDTVGQGGLIKEAVNGRRTTFPVFRFKFLCRKWLMRRNRAFCFARASHRQANNMNPFRVNRFRVHASVAVSPHLILESQVVGRLDQCLPELPMGRTRSRMSDV